MSCRLCRAGQAGLDQATRLWPHRNTASDGGCGDSAHAARVSDHNPDSRGIAHAFDLTNDPMAGCDAHREADAIRLRAKAGQEPRAKYIISNRRYAGPDTGWNWVGYSGENPHTAHAHFSITTSGENDTSPWYDSEGDWIVGAKEDIINTVQNQGELTRAKIAASEARLSYRIRRFEGGSDRAQEATLTRLHLIREDIAALAASSTGAERAAAEAALAEFDAELSELVGDGDPGGT